MSSRPTRATIDGRAYLDLQNLARRTQRSTQDLLHLYALEGFLARLAISPHAAKLVLKGGVLLAAYGNRRATRDIDLQGRQVANDIDTVLGLVREIISTHIDDGLAFRPDTATAAYIREDDSYHGIRVDLIAHLATARIGFHVDVNVGDPIWPPPERIIIPGILDRDVPLKGYPLPMVHAEKIVTGVDRGPHQYTLARLRRHLHALRAAPCGRRPAPRLYPTGRLLPEGRPHPASHQAGRLGRHRPAKMVNLAAQATTLGHRSRSVQRYARCRHHLRRSRPHRPGSGATWHPGRRSWH